MGLVDAFSDVVLGRVSFANTTGNVVFLGFADPGHTGFRLPPPGNARRLLRRRP
jgi:hypothetical protein